MVACVLGRPTRPGSPLALRPRRGEVTGLRAHAVVRGPTHLRVATTENTVDLDTLIAQWSGKVPPGFVQHTVKRQQPPRCSQRRCKRPCAVKANGDYAVSCQSCLDRRAASCRRRRAALAAEGGCRRCAYRKRLAGDFLCQRCRDERDVERAQKRLDALDAAAIDEFAAQPDKAHKASNLDLGVSPWNARPAPQSTAAYWSPLPDPEPVAEQDWRWSPMNGRLHRRY